MRKEKLPRGIHRRHGSLVISFAYEGKVKYLSLGNCSLAFAKDELSGTKKKIREGNYVPKVGPVAPVTTYTVADLWPIYRANYENLGGRDTGRQEIAWKRLKPTFGALTLEAVNTGRIVEYIAIRKAKGVQNGTVNRELSVLAAMFHLGARFTAANGKPMVDRVPAFPSKLKEGEPRKGFIGEPQYAALIEHAKEPWLRAFVECAYTFGFRKGELLSLRVNQCDLLDRWIRLSGSDTKNGRPRKVKMTDRVYARLLDCVRGKAPDAFVFTRADGGRVVDPRKDWYALCVASGLGAWVPAKRRKGEDYKKYVGLNLHDFRRSAIRNMTRRGVTEKIAMTISGHTTRSVFDRYDIGDEADLADASAKIEAGREVQSAGKSHTKVIHADSGLF